MTYLWRQALRPIERGAIAEIDAIRQAIKVSRFPKAPPQHAALIRYLILMSHGHVQLRTLPLARELGIEMRTLERAFLATFGETMAQCHTRARLDYARWLLSVNPTTKIAAIAAALGYNRVQDFNRFFKKHVRLTPKQWAIVQHKRTTAQSTPESTDPR
jgi:transcriptional regulator GlxA family with amidase domain